MKNIGTKKALGIVTYNRPEFFQEILGTTRFNEVDEVYVVDASGTNVEQGKCRMGTVGDGSDKLRYIKNDVPAAVGTAKNLLLDAMIEDGMDHLFLQEDDVAITDDGVFDLYIETAKQSGMWGGLNYAWHGNGNKGSMGEHQIKNSVDLDDEIGLVLTENGTAAFSYFHREVIEKMGKFPEPPDYVNALEHLAHYQKLASYKLTSFMYWFPDAKGSENYIKDLDDGNHGGSVIRKDGEWTKNFHHANACFKKEFGFFLQDIPRATPEQVLERLEFLVENYSV